MLYQNYLLYYPYVHTNNPNYSAHACSLVQHFFCTILQLQHSLVVLHYHNNTYPPICFEHQDGYLVDFLSVETKLKFIEQGIVYADLSEEDKAIYALSQEGFFNGTSIPVNRSLLTIFVATQYAEQSGHGVPTIVGRYGREVFSFEDCMIKVTIPLSYEREEVSSRKRTVIQKNTLTKNQKNVYDYLSNNPEASLQNVADALGLSLGGVKKICSKLQEYGVLERSGSKKDGRWLVK